MIDRKLSSITCPICHDTFFRAEKQMKLYCSRTCTDRAHNLIKKFNRDFRQELDYLDARCCPEKDSGMWFRMAGDLIDSKTYSGRVKLDFSIPIVFDLNSRFIFSDVTVKALLVAAKICVLMYQATGNMPDKATFHRCFEMIKDQFIRSGKYTEIQFSVENGSDKFPF